MCSIVEEFITDKLKDEFERETEGIEALEEKSLSIKTQILRICPQVAGLLYEYYEALADIEFARITDKFCLGFKKGVTLALEIKNDSE